MLISSHILDELSRLATHYGFIDGGCMIKEISAQELESRCRKCIRASVSSTGALARVLDAMGAAYSIVDDSQADIYGEADHRAGGSAGPRRLHGLQRKGARRKSGKLLYGAGGR